MQRETSAGPKIATRRPSEVSDESAWVLTAHEPRTEPLYLANGYMGTSLDFVGGILFESGPAPCYIRGVYTVSGPDSIDRLAVVPSWNLFRYGHPSKVEGYRRQLDLRHGILRTELLLREDRGQVRLVGEILMSRADRHQATVRLEIEPSFDGEIRVLAGLDALVGSDARVVGVEADERALFMHSRVKPYGIDVYQSLCFEHTGAAIEALARQNSSTALLTFTARSGERLVATQLSRTATTLDSDDPESLAAVDHQTSDHIRARHVEAWDQLWQTDIEIEGDPEVQQFARAALFYLWSTMGPDDNWSIAPMGLSGNFYNGHVFWDAELWMYPSLLLTQPSLARSCTAYRERTLPAARQRAAQSGHAGAQFPWEGGFTGGEMTPPWAETRDYQLHITADVAIGQWWYYLVTLDREWLRHHGFPVIRACAEYWVSRVEHNVGAARYEISDVVCADEYAEHVNNDAFTNASVRKALHIAVRAAELLGEPAPREWSDIADKLYIPYDAAHGRHLEFDGYDGRVTKQADVELLAFPLEFTTDPAQIERDLDYYADVIDPDGPAMSFSVYSIVSAQLGRAEDAYSYLKKGFIPNTKQPFWSFSETPTNNEYFFCTGIGGALQAFIFGFTGLRLREDHMVLKPILPPRWRALRLRGLYVQGTRVDLEVERQRTLVRRYLTDGVVSMDIRRDVGEVALLWPDSMGTVRIEVQGPEGEGTESSDVLPGTLISLPSGHAGGCRVRAIDDAKTPVMDVILGPLTR